MNIYSRYIIKLVRRTHEIEKKLVVCCSGSNIVICLKLTINQQQNVGKNFQKFNLYGRVIRWLCLVGQKKNICMWGLLYCVKKIWKSMQMLNQIFFLFFFLLLLCLYMIFGHARCCTCQPTFKECT